MAQACVHNEPFWTDFLLSCETEASKATVPAMSLSDCIDACRADPVISTCASFSYQRQFRPISGEYCLDRDPIKEAVLGLAGNEMHALAIQYRVDPNNLERATAELINAAGMLLKFITLILQSSAVSFMKKVGLTDYQYTWRLVHKDLPMNADLISSFCTQSLLAWATPLSLMNHPLVNTKNPVSWNSLVAPCSSCTPH